MLLRNQSVDVPNGYILVCFLAQELPSYLMLIYVDAPSGRTTGVSLRPSDTVADLKVRIEDVEWIPQGTAVIKLH